MKQKSWLECCQRHGLVRSSHPGSTRSGEPIDSTGDVHSEHASARSARRRPGISQTGSKGRIDDQVDIAHRGACGIGGIDDSHSGAACGQTSRRHPPISTVETRAGHDHDMSTVGPIQHGQSRPSDRRTRPFDENLYGNR